MHARKSWHSPEEPSMSEWSFIYAAYGLTWITFVVYALYLRARRRRIEAAAAEGGES